MLDKNHLPICEHETNWTWKIANYDCFTEKKKLDELYRHLRELIGTNCWAVTIGEQVIFNNYINFYVKNFKDYKDMLLSNMIRDELHRNIHNMVHPMNTDTMRIYMFVAESWMVSVNYDTTKKEFVVRRYNSYLETE